MKADIETLTARIDALTGGMGAMNALLLSLVETHPNPQQLKEVFEVFLQRTLAGHSHSPYGDGLLDAIHDLSAMFRTQIQICAEKSTG